jgi:hypothetical protein
MEYTVDITERQFREYLVEGDNGPWGDNYYESIFRQYITDGYITITYKYGEYKDGKSMIKWRVSENPDKVYAVRYGGSSCFAMWWGGITDELEYSDDEDEEHICHTCSEEMNDEDFQKGKMCCDKPMFHNDYDDSE